MKSNKPAKSRLTVFAQLCKLIPGHLVQRLSAAHGVDELSRSFSAWSHVVALLYAQLAHCVGLNDVCDNLRLHGGWLSTIRGATPPSRNGLSHANKIRNSSMMEALFWQTLSHLQSLTPAFGLDNRYKGLPHRFKRAVHALDSSTITLVANCMPWAKHRRRKAAAKLHLRLNLQSFLPAFALVEEACHHDDVRARALCAGLAEGEVAVFDKAYVNFAHLFELTLRGIFWVTRAKDNMAYRVCKRLIKKPQGKVLKDELITLTVPKSRKEYNQRLRRVEMEVEIDGKAVVMVFITNNFEWAASSVGGLYQSRWGIEVFFKQIKQTLQICDFLGHNKQAIQWQLWAALLLYVLLRYQMFLSGWNHSFTRIFTLIRGAAWDRYCLFSLLRSHGTAGGCYRMCGYPQSAYLPGFAPS
jgi:hypothetical protein